MYLGELGEQTVLMSQKAFSQIHFEGFQPASRKHHYPRKTARDKEARKAYKQQRTLEQALDAVYILDILRERWGSDDARLRRNIS